MRNIDLISTAEILTTYRRKMREASATGTGTPERQQLLTETNHLLAQFNTRPSQERLTLIRGRKVIV